MFGFNWVDLIIVVLLSWAVTAGVGIGVVTQTLVIIGFFGTLFAAGWLYPHLLPIHDTTLKTLVNTFLVLFTAMFVAARCFDLAGRIHRSFRVGWLKPGRKLQWLDTLLGSVVGIAAGLTLVWLLGVAVVRLPFEGFSNSVNDSRIVQQLVRTLPSVPAVFTWFDRRVNPNDQPQVFAHLKPYKGFEYSAADVATAEAKAQPSIVRITSFGCGGLVSGTGFTVAPHLIATNAHVIAGIKRPIVKYGDSSYEATPVYFDQILDLAIVRVQKLNVPPIALAKANVLLGTTVAVLGYPGGNYQTIPGIVRDTRAVSATTIYDKGSFGRGVYVVQTHLEYGNSGGPIVTAAGQVAGIVFSKSLGVADYGYALTSPHIIDALNRSKDSRRRVGTGACMVQ